MFTIYAIGIIVVLFTLFLIRYIDNPELTSKESRRNDVNFVILMAATSWLGYLIILI